MVTAAAWVGIGMLLLGFAGVMGRRLKDRREKDSKPWRPSRGLRAPGQHDDTWRWGRRRG